MPTFVGFLYIIEMWLISGNRRGEMETKKPNLFIVGAAKSGTTSLYTYLKNHPNIYFPDRFDFPGSPHNLKEPKYFSSKYHTYPHMGPRDTRTVDDTTVRELKTYLEYYSKAKNEKYLGDASTDYLYYFETADDIYDFNRDGKIIISLRNPAERAYSAYTHLRRAYRENLTFEKALEKEEERIRGTYEHLWAYKESGLYYNRVKHFIEVFGRENVHVVIFDDLKRDADEVLDGIYRFLGSDRAGTPAQKKIYNKSGIPKDNLRVRMYNKLTSQTGKFKRILKGPRINRFAMRVFLFIKDKLFTSQLVKGRMEKETKGYLQSYYKEDMENLEKLLDIDLSRWSAN